MAKNSHSEKCEVVTQNAFIVTFHIEKVNHVVNKVIRVHSVFNFGQIISWDNSSQKTNIIAIDLQVVLKPILKERF